MSELQDSVHELDMSILIATRNRAKLLENTLDLLSRQALPDLRWEVIVVDNGSDDDTPTVLESALEKLPLHRFYEPQLGKSRCLNKALDMAKGELIVFTDDDITAPPEWLAELYRASVEHPDYNVFCGPIVPLYPPDKPDWFNPDSPHAVIAFSKFVFSQDEGPLEAETLPFGPNYAVRKKSLTGLRFCHRLGPQRAGDSTLADETDLLQRLWERGERAFYVPTAGVSHHVDRRQFELDWLHERAFRWGRGLVRMKPDRKSIYLFGVPWYLWRRVPQYWINYNLAKIRFAFNNTRGNRVRLGTGARYYANWGRFYEYRKLSQENREKASFKRCWDYCCINRIDKAPQ
jgi:glycosyltransferase involved in cell wall biosynthesis